MRTTSSSSGGGPGMVRGWSDGGPTNIGATTDMHRRCTRNIVHNMIILQPSLFIYKKYTINIQPTMFLWRQKHHNTLHINIIFNYQHKFCNFRLLGSPKQSKKAPAGKICKGVLEGTRKKVSFRQRWLTAHCAPATIFFEKIFCPIGKRLYFCIRFRPEEGC